MADVESGGGDAGGNSRLVETIAANLDSAWTEVQQQRSNEQHAWMTWAHKMTAEETGAAAEGKSHRTDNAISHETQSASRSLSR